MRKGASTISDLFLSPECWHVVVGAPGGVKPGKTPRGLAPPSAKRRAWSKENAHARPFRELLLVAQGMDWFGIGGVLYPRLPGTLFSIEPHVPHDLYYPPKTDNLEHIWICVFGKYVRINWKSIRNGTHRRLHRNLSVISSEKLGISLKQFPDPGTPLDDPRDVARMRLLVGLVTTYLEPYVTARKKRKPTETNSPQQNVVRAIRNHIEETAGKGITLDELANFSGYSKYHLHRLFRTQTGCTVHEYIDLIRYRRMCLLRNAGTSNTAITEELGFTNVSAFLRWRRKQGRRMTDLPP